MAERQGLIHLYTGDGKGKTTAAMGLAVRAAGAGMKVVFAQFMKGSDTSELKSLSTIDGITIIRSSEDLGWFNSEDSAQTKKYTDVHNNLLGEIETLVMNGQCDMLVLDEVTYPFNYEIFDKDRFINLLADSPETMEIVMTGRNADQFLCDCADYITEMKKIRHPYDLGINGRLGIEF